MDIISGMGSWGFTQKDVWVTVLVIVGSLSYFILLYLAVKNASRIMNLVRSALMVNGAYQMYRRNGRFTEGNDVDFDTFIRSKADGKGFKPYYREYRSRLPRYYDNGVIPTGRKRRR